MKHSLLLVAVMALVAFAAPAHSQYMFLDTNLDGVCDTNDVLGPASSHTKISSPWRVGCVSAGT